MLYGGNTGEAQRRQREATAEGVVPYRDDVRMATGSGEVQLAKELKVS